MIAGRYIYAPHVTIIALYPPGELNDWDDARNHPDYGTAACRALLGLSLDATRYLLVKTTAHPQKMP